MATATQQPHFAHGGPNGHARGHGKYVAYRPAEDDDSIATEQFPEFDPSHDGSEEESSSGDGNYTHRAANSDSEAPADGSAAVMGDRGGASHDELQHRPLFDDVDDGSRVSPIDPSPKPEQRPQSPQHQERVLSPVTSPPYWAHNHNHNHSYGAEAHAQDHINSLNLSTESLVPGAITLQDNEADGEPQDREPEASETRTSYGRDRNKACWAKSVEVTDYVIVNGSTTNIGAFVVWNIRVQTLSVSRPPPPREDRDARQEVQKPWLNTPLRRDRT